MLVADTLYTTFNELTETQTSIMRFFDDWVHKNETPLSRVRIIANFDKNIDKATVIYSLNVLLRKGYIRRVYHLSNKTYYVMLRRVI